MTGNTIPSGSGRCDKPPEGWFCTRSDGHDGPCAAWPANDREPVRIPDYVLTERHGLFSGYCPCGWSKLDRDSPEKVGQLMAQHMRIAHPEPPASGEVER